MSIFYVYLRWFREADGRSADQGRQLLTCSSRYAADEFYRALEEVRFSDGRHWFTKLERQSPQYWSFDSVDSDPWHTVLYVLRTTGMDAYRKHIMTLWVPDATSRDFITTPIDTAPDWVHEGTYFIRNKRQPKLYWYHFEGAVHISETQKTKFRVRGTAFAKGEKKVLIRSDVVEFRPVDKGCSKTPYLTQEHESTRIKVSWDKRVWKFGDLVGGFGTTWEKAGDTVHELLTTATDDEGDNWELC